MKKNLRMLALGFLISAVVLLVYNQFFSTQTKADETKATSTKAGSDENSSTWKNKYEKLLAQQEVDKATEAEAKKKPKKMLKKAEEAKKVKSYTLKISKGDPSSKAGDELQTNGIIKSASDFDKYLRDNDYEKYIRDGSYNLKSDMSYETIAKILTHKN